LYKKYQNTVFDILGCLGSGNEFEEILNEFLNFPEEDSS